MVLATLYIGLAVQLENRYRGIRSPQKFKGGVSGCVKPKGRILGSLPQIKAGTVRSLQQLFSLLLIPHF
jgi:hypothetical protein